MMARKKWNIWWIIVIVVVSIQLILFVIGQFRTSEPQKTPKSSSSAPASQMRDDATLDFLSEQGNTVASISVEIADSEAQRIQGLMGRTRIEEHQGMLFIFDNEEERSFWMANTPLPLDIIFVNAQKKIVKIHRHTRPYSEESLPSNSPAQFVVEVNAGFSDKFGLQEGQTIAWIRK